MEREGELSTRSWKPWRGSTPQAGDGVAGRGMFPVLTAMAMSLAYYRLARGVGGAPCFCKCFRGSYVLQEGLHRHRAGDSVRHPAELRGSYSRLCSGRLLSDFVVDYGFGEIIGVFRAIEGNIHQLISSVEQAWNQTKLTGEGGQH